MRDHRRHLVAGAAALLVSCGGYLRPPKPDQHAVFEAKVTRFESSNGFRFIVLPDDNASVVRLDVRYHVGAMADPPGKEGLAHLIEHMMFQTRLKTSGGMMTVSQILGGTAQWSNAYTDLDSTHYMAQIAPEHLGNVFALEIARLSVGCSSWDEETFIREREVVRNEIRNDHIEAWGDVPQLLHEAAYPPGHPYRRTTGGTDASLARVTLADACAFVEKNYRPGNITIVASGRTTEAEIKKLASEQLTRFPPVALAKAPVVPPAPVGRGQIITHELDIDEPTLVALFPLPAQGTRARRMVDIARGGIGRMLGSYAGFQDWGHGASVAVIGGARAPLLAVSIAIRDLDEVGTARSAIGTSMRRAVNNTKYIDDERWRTPVWLWYKESVIAEFEDFSSRPAVFADYEQFDEEPLFIIGRLQELDIVKSEDIHDVGEKYLDPEHATYVLFKPKRGARTSGAGGFAYRATAHDPSSWRFPVDVSEADQPLALPRDRPRRLPVIEHRMDNGLRVLMWPHGTTPMTYGRLVVAAGGADEPVGEAGLAGVVGGAVGFDVTQTSWRELSVDMDLVVEGLSGFLRHGATQNLTKWREQAGRVLKLPHAIQRAEYEAAFQAAIYGADHPYGRGVMTPQSLERIDGDEVAAFERQFHTAGNSTLILTGMFDPELAKKHVRYQFGHLASKARGARRIPAIAPRHGRQVVTFHADEQSPVVEIQVAFPAAEGIDRSLAARMILERVISARLSMLREGLAVTYGMQAGYTPRLGPGEWRISGQLDAARAAEGIESLQRVLAEVRGDPEVWKGDFVLARRKAVDELLVAVNSPSTVATQLAFVAAFDLPLDFRDQLVDQLAGVRPADLQRIIAAELAADDEVVGLFGPARAVDAVAAALK